MTVSITELRQNIYKLIDQAIETGEPITILRHGHTVRIVADRPASRLASLKKQSVIRGNPDDLVGIQWADAWSGESKLP